MRILITGGAGFVGSRLALALKQEDPSRDILVLDSLKRRGAELNVPMFTREGIEFFHGDIRNIEDFDVLKDLDFIIDASAEPSVLAGIDGAPSQVININLIGTINILNLAVKHGARLIFLSTSRVYAIESLNSIAYVEDDTRFSIAQHQTQNGISADGINEDFDVLGYRSIYGATKLASEILIEEYNQYCGLKSIVNRCGVIAGPGQMGKIDQGVVVLWAARHFWQKGLAYFGYGGTGKQVRDILHIDDLADLISIQINRFDEFNGQKFNVGGGLDSSVSLQELTKICQEVIGNRVEIKQQMEDRSADVRLYITDNHRIHAKTGWLPTRNAEHIVGDIVKWMKENEGSLKPILNM